MSLEFPNIEISQIYTLHFQNLKFYEIKYEKSLGRVEIFCGKLGPSNTKIMDRIYALYKEIQGEEQVKNFMKECLTKKLTKGYQFLDPPKPPKASNKKVPATTSTSVLGKRSGGQKINKIEPDVTKKLNSHPDNTQNIINPEPIPQICQNIQAMQLSLSSPKSPSIELESPSNPSSSPNVQGARSPISMVEEIQQSYKTVKRTQEKKPPKPELPKKNNPPSLPKNNISTQIKEEHKNEKPNLFTSPPKVDKSDLFTSPQKINKPNLLTSSPKLDNSSLFSSPPKIDKTSLFIPPPKIEPPAFNPTFFLNHLQNVNTDKSNPQIPQVKIEPGSVNPVLPRRGIINKNSVPPVKNEDTSEGTKFFNNSPDQKREEFIKKLKKVAPGDCPFGEPSLDSHEALTVPSKWENEDVKDWYISEKLGGIRCFWTGFEMLSKSGPQCSIPDFFISRLPKSPLDGELVMKGGSLSRCMMIVKKKPTDLDYEKEWNNMNFVVYDAPEAEGTFEKRLKALEDYFKKSDGLYVNLHEYQKCKGKSHAEEELKKEEKKGGEGILLTNPEGKYLKGKTKDVLERKSKFEGVAKVKEVITEKGRPQVITSLRVENLKGIEFMINRGITNELTRNPPQVGSEIVYEYKGILDSEKPKAPVYKSMVLKF